MDIYRFTIRDGMVLPDIQISRHQTIAEARREAIGIVHTLAQAADLGRSEDWFVDVANEEGTILFTLALRFLDAPNLASIENPSLDI